jgi:hypothetical protein
MPRYGITTLADLVGRPEAELARLKNSGRKDALVVNPEGGNVDEPA